MNKNILCSFLVFSFLATSCSKKVEQEFLRPVSTLKVSKPGFSRHKVFSGLSKADDTLELSFRLEGRLESLTATTGTKVKKGSLLAKLDSTDAELEVKKTEAQVAETVARVKQAKSEYERDLSLYEANNISKSELDTQEANYLSAKAQLAAKQKSLNLAKKKLGYCWLYAPQDGVIQSVPPSNHEVVIAGQIIAELQVEGPIEVSFGVPESFISEFKLGQEAKVRFDFIEDKKLRAKVNEVGVAPDSSTTYPVKISLLDTDSRIRPGMACDVEFEFERQVGEKYIILPSASVIGDVSAENYIWVYDEPTSSVKKQLVKIGKLSRDGIQILSGLEGGELVVTRGVNTLEEGMKVKLL